MTRISIKVSPETHEHLKELQIEHGFSSFDKTILFLHQQLNEQEEIDNIQIRRIETLQKQNDELHQAFLSQQEVAKNLKQLIGSVERIGEKVDICMNNVRLKK